jgi:hypothetical protein
MRKRLPARKSCCSATNASVPPGIAFAPPGAACHGCGVSHPNQDLSMFSLFVLALRATTGHLQLTHSGAPIL